MLVLLAFLVLVHGGFALEFEVLENHGLSLHEGDIKLNPAQQVGLDWYGDPTRSVGRGLTKDPTLLWSSLVVPYDVSKELEQEPDAVKAINDGIREWEENTCLRFVRRTNEKDYIEMFKGSGCWSWVGRQGGKQQLSLAYGCWYLDVVAHEIGHAVGLWHEQSRPDRDKYVKIVWNNIPSDRQYNFYKYNRSMIDSLGVPYDYLSIMHYQSTAFSSNGQPTIIPKDKSQIQLSQRVGLSPLDVKQADLLYKCKGLTTRPRPTVRPPPSDTCTFDTMGDTCGFHNVDGDDFDWTQRLGETPSGWTGPEADHTTGRWGWFMYIETSSPRVQGEKAILSSKAYPASSERCLHFYYHMFGDHIGQLNVTWGPTGSPGKALWSRSGKQGNTWLRADVELPSSATPYKISFVGVRGNGYQGDVAIDDVSFTDGKC